MKTIKNLRFGVKLGAGYAVVLGLMMIISIVVYTNITTLVKSTEWVEHTHKVIRVAEGVQAAMVDMETGQRGFMITGEDEYLEPFYLGIENFKNLIAKGKQLTSDNPQQGTRWQEIFDLEQRWSNEVAKHEISARREVTKGAQALAHFKTVSSRTVGKEIFDSIRTTLSTLNNQFTDNLEGQHIITLITLDLVNMETGQRGFLLTGKQESLQPYTHGLETFNKHLMDLQTLSKYSSVNAEDVLQLEQRTNAWMEKAANPEIQARREMNQYSVTIEDIAEMMKKGDGKKLMDATRGKLTQIIDAEELLITVRSKEQQEASDFTINFTLLGTLIAIFLGASIGFIVIRGVVNPIKQTNGLIEEISDGNLTRRIPVESGDEIGEMSNNFNNFTEKLQDTIRQISDSTTQLAKSAGKLATVTEQTSSGINNQQIETEQVATAINQMSSTVKEVAQSAAQASMAASEADNEAKSGRQVVNDTIKSIENVANEINESASVIAQLRTDSENIGTVLDVIKGIAEQTNLLALNAAIEAARAGEQGRGFAVVADEVRTLAQRTQESTTEIESLIVSLQNGTQRSVTVMEQSRTKVSKSVEQAQTAGDSLASITKAVDTILEMNTHIASAAEEQNSVAAGINSSVHSIQQITDQTALGAKQTADSSIELATLGTHLQDAIKQFKI